MSSYLCLNPHCKGRRRQFVSEKSFGCIYKNPLRVGISSLPVCLRVITQVLNLTTG